MSCNHIANFLKGVNDKRYISDFEEISKIGSGGFSSVFKVKNKLDDNFYAVKKIQLRIKDMKNDINAELEHVLREAKFLAKVFHPNVIRYYNSWIELKMHDKAMNLSNENLKLKKDFFLDQTNLSFDQNQNDAHMEFCLDEQKQKGKYKNKDSSINDQSEFVLEIDSNNNLDIDFEDSEKNEPNLKASQKNNVINSSNDNLACLEFESNSGICDVDFDRSDSPELKHKPNSQLIITTNTKKDEKLKKDKEIMQYPQPKKNPIYKLLDKKAGNQKFENSQTPPPKNSKYDYLENIKSILIYIQTELCQRTLEKYINERNHKLALIANELYNYQDLKVKYFQEAKIILEQVISALAYIHKNCQLVHRDLKPSNIFLNKDLNAKIGDFGLVKKLENLAPVEPPLFLLSPTLSQESSPLIERNSKELNSKNLHNAAEDILMLRMKAQTPVDQKANIYPDALLKERASFKTRNCGTKVYASPEQMAQNCYFDFRADIYSLGIIMVQLFYPMKTEMELIQTLNNAKKKIYPKELTKDLPQITKLIGKMLDENPENRPSLKV